MPIGRGRSGWRMVDIGFIRPSAGFAVSIGIAQLRPFLTAPLTYPSPQSLLTCLSLIPQRLAASFVLIILCMDIPPSIILRIHYIILSEQCQEHYSELYSEQCKHFLNALFRKKINGPFCPIDVGVGLRDPAHLKRPIKLSF